MLTCRDGSQSIDDGREDQGAVEDDLARRLSDCFAIIGEGGTERNAFAEHLASRDLTDEWVCLSRNSLECLMFACHAEDNRYCRWPTTGSIISSTSESSWQKLSLFVICIPIRTGNSICHPSRSSSSLAAPWYGQLTSMFGRREGEAGSPQTGAS